MKVVFINNIQKEWESCTHIEYFSQNNENMARLQKIDDKSTTGLAVIPLSQVLYFEWIQKSGG